MPNPIEILAKGGKALLKKAAESKAAAEDLAKDGAKAGKSALRSSRSAAKDLLEDSHSLSFKQSVPRSEVKVPKIKSASHSTGKHIEKPLPTEHSTAVRSSKAQPIEVKSVRKGSVSTAHKTESLDHEGHKTSPTKSQNHSTGTSHKSSPEAVSTHEKTSANRVAAKKVSHSETTVSKDFSTKEKAVSKAAKKAESHSVPKVEEHKYSVKEPVVEKKSVKSSSLHTEKETATKLEKESQPSKSSSSSSETKKKSVSSLENAKENDSLVNEARVARQNAAKAEALFDKHGTHESMIAWREAMEKSAALDEKVMALGESAAKASGLKNGSAIKSEIDNAIDSAVEARVRVKELKEQVKENPALQKELFSALDAEKSATERAMKYGYFTEKEITRGFKSRFPDVEKAANETVVKGQPVNSIPNRGIPQGKYSGLSEENQMKILSEENAIERSKVSVQEKKVDVDASIKQEDSALKKYKAENEAELAKEKLAIEKEKISAETVAKQEEHSLNRFKAESEVELNREKNIIEKEKVFSESRRGDRELGLKERELELKEKEINTEKLKARVDLIKKPIGYITAGAAVIGGFKLVAYDGGLIKQIDDTLNGAKESKRDKDGKLIEPETNLLGHTSETVLGKETTQRIGSAVDGLEGAAGTVLNDGQKVFDFTFDTANGVKNKVSDAVDYTGKKATDYLDNSGDSKYYSRAIDPATGQPAAGQSSPHSTVQETIDNLRNGRINSSELGKLGVAGIAMKAFGKGTLGIAGKIAGTVLGIDGLHDMNVRNRNQGVGPVTGGYNPYYEENLVETIKPASHDDSYHMKR